MIDFDVPIPRSEPINYEPFEWQVRQRKKLPQPNLMIGVPFSQVLDRRRTRREFMLLHLGKLSTFLHWSARTQSFREINDCVVQKRKYVASAGSIHPVDLLIWRGSEGWYRYDDFSHEVHAIALGARLASSLVLMAEECLSIRSGTLFVFIAEPGKTNVLYHNPESLVWRDTGVLIGHMSIVAESLGCNFCPLGITGQPLISEIDPAGRLLGVGMAILG